MQRSPMLTSSKSSGSSLSLVCQPCSLGSLSVLASTPEFFVFELLTDLAFNSIRFRKAWLVQGHSLEELPFRALGGHWGSWFGVVLIVLVLIAQFYIAIWPIGGMSDNPRTVAESFFGKLTCFCECGRLSTFIRSYFPCCPRYDPFLGDRISLETNTPSPCSRD